MAMATGPTLYTKPYAISSTRSSIQAHSRTSPLKDLACLHHHRISSRAELNSGPISQPLPLPLHRFHSDIILHCRSFTSKQLVVNLRYVNQSFILISFAC
jgi:hypothetical protein